MVRSKKPLSVVSVFALVLSLTAVASAQGFFGVSIGGHDHHGRHGRRGGVSVNIGFPVGQVSHCAPVHVHHGGCRQWIPGHFENRCEQVWVPGTCRQVWVAPVYRTEYTSCGTPIQVLVCPGRFETVQEPGRYETVNRQVWIEGRWNMTCGF